MPHGSAIEDAVKLLLMPTSLRAMQETRLPPGMIDLLSILAGDQRARERASKQSGRPVETLVDAAIFYASHVLFTAEATAYRTLGAEPGASRQELRTNMSLLLRWLHPDHRENSEELDRYYSRVLRAWDILRPLQHGDQSEQRGLPARWVPGRAGLPAMGAQHFLTRRTMPAEKLRRFGLRRRKQLCYLIAVVLLALSVIALQLDLFDSVLGMRQ